MARRQIGLVVCFLFTTLAAGAGPNDGYSGLFGSSNLEIGSEIFYQQYQEPGVMRETGMMYGVYGSYTYRRWLAPAAEGDEALAKKPMHWMIGANGGISFGQLNYDGELMDGTPYRAGGVDNVLVEARLLVGPDFPKEKRIDTIYIGFGFRYLDSDIGPDPTGYQRESRYFYIPVGIATTGNWRDGWSLGAGAEFDLLLHGLQTSHLGGEVGDVDNPQHGGFGLRGSIRLGKNGKHHNLIVEPFIRYWQIQTSEVSQGYVEPRNDTTEVGVRLIWRF